nr:collagen alpha-3(V) chain-like [Parasteatoda tepidariorum]
MQHSILLLNLFIFFTISGWFWVDPNLGMIDDAIHVFCNMTARGQTCVYPDKHSAIQTEVHWEKEEDASNEKWFSSLRGGFKVIMMFIILSLWSKLLMIIVDVDTQKVVNELAAVFEQSDLV